MQGPLVWITGTYYRRTQADPSSLSRGKWEPAMLMGGWGSRGLGSRGVNRSLWAGCHPTWLVPSFNEGVSLRSFQKPSIEKLQKNLFLPLNLLVTLKNIIAPYISCGLLRLHQVVRSLIIFKVTLKHVFFITLTTISSWPLNKLLSFTVLSHIIKGGGGG